MFAWIYDMSNVVGLFYAEIRVTITVSHHIRYKNISSLSF